MATITKQIHIFSYKPPNIQRKLASNVCRVPAGAAAVPRRLRSIRCDAEPVRRSGNYKPSLWDFDYIQSLKSPYKEERYSRRASELVEQVSAMLAEKDERVEGLVLIDALQRLGISCHFRSEISQFLSSVYEEHKCKDYDQERDLYSTCLEFRLLRQHGFKVPQEVFDCFKNEKGSFHSIHSGDTKGLLQLYEASFLLTEGEKTLEIAREFSSYFLRKKLDDDDDDEYLSLLTRHALEIPIHWGVQMPNARWFIDVYEKIPGTNPAVLELAKLDFNIVQATYQQELKHVSKWWKSACLAEKLPFARDRILECYFWTTGIFELRQHGHQRITEAKINALITSIDDIFDVYGTLEELQLFTDSIRRWDIGSIGELPDYMQLCYLALHNFVNEMAYDVLKEQGFVIIPYLRKSWTDLIESYWREANWYHDGYKPSLQEFLDNAWISIGAPVILTGVYFVVTTECKEAVESLYAYHDIVRCSSMILRLADDLGTSADELKRGDVPKSIQCYMSDRNASEKEGREHVESLIREAWKEMNKLQTASDCPFSGDFIACAANVGRMALFMYHDGDGHGGQNSHASDHIADLLFEPYPYQLRKSQEFY